MVFEKTKKVMFKLLPRPPKTFSKAEDKMAKRKKVKRKKVK